MRGEFAPRAYFWPNFDKTEREMTGEPSRFSQAVESIEETFIAVALGFMTLITFANVIARYVFNSNILWGLEVTVVLFAWLVLV
ncbi:MAG TPA: TRAP transporter small permease subunit, partial [Denitromonas sp.]|nr:TRAP transporter small permease subunit [Denitromonas sp.]